MIFLCLCFSRKYPFIYLYLSSVDTVARGVTNENQNMYTKQKENKTLKTKLV